MVAKGEARSTAKPKAKPRPLRLKVFRTPIGFHDAYVAASSRKAALAAWGTDKDLFARGAAEEVVDPALMAEPLEQPGKVIRRLRAGPADLAAPRKPRRRPAEASSPPPPPAPPPLPRPDNRQLEEARRAVAEAQRRHEDEERALAARERELAEARRMLEQRQGKELRLLRRKLDQAEEDYAVRLARWREVSGS